MTKHDAKLNRSLRSLVVGVLLVASGALAGRTLFVRSAPSNAEVQGKGSAKENDDRRVAALEQEMRRLRAVVASQQAAARVAAVDEARASNSEQESVKQERPAAPVDPVEEARVAEQARAEYLDDLAAQVESEPRDARFGAETEPVISRLLPQHLGDDVQVSDVACASSICRAKVTHPGSPRLSEPRLSDFLLQRGTLGAMSLQLDVRVDGVTTMYFIRSDT